MTVPLGKFSNLPNSDCLVVLNLSSPLQITSINSRSLKNYKIVNVEKKFPINYEISAIIFLLVVSCGIENTDK